MSEDVIYGIELYLPSDSSWHMLCNCNDLKSAKSTVEDYELSDICNCMKFDYRIVKVTTIKEVVG